MRSPADIRLFVADVDGTIGTSDKRVTQRTRAIVERLRAAGIGLSLTSRRPPRGAALAWRGEAEWPERSRVRASAAGWQRYCTGVTHPDANKASAVRSLTRMVDVPLTKIACIGDMPSDVLMFGVAGLSIPMGKASPE